MIDGPATIWILRVLFTLTLWVLLLRTARVLERSARVPEPAATAAAVLVLLSGGGRPGTRIDLRRATTFGHDPANDVVFEDEFVSGRHFTVWPEGTQWWVVDAGTRNGTYLNGELLLRPRAVNDGDHLQAGRSRFRLAVPRAAR